MSAFSDDLEDRIRIAAPGGCALRHDRDSHGVTVAWCELAVPADLVPVAALLKKTGARLSTITALQPHPPEADDDEAGDEDAAAASGPLTSLSGLPIDGKTYELLYHFDLDGDTLSLMVFLPESGGSVASLTPLYRHADWSERELMEIYDLTVVDHPNPRRLFIDEAIDPAVLERLIPFSTLVNAASTKSLWEKITAGRGDEA